MKILLIEDNQRTQEWVTRGFPKRVMSLMPFLMAEMGLSCAEGWLCIDHSGYYASGYDGWQILQTLRTAKQTPVICLLQGILSMTESEGWTVEQMITGKTFFIFWVAGKGSGTIKAHHALNSTLEISGLRMDSVSQVWAGTISVLHWRARSFSYFATGLQSWRNYTQNGYCEWNLGINFDSDTNTVDVAIRRLRAKLMILFLKS